MKTRGEILTTLVLVVALAGVAGVLAGWKPLDAFRKKPPVEQLTKLQNELLVAQAVAEQAARDREAAVVAERAKLESQVRAAQEDNVGTETALARVPAEHRTAEVNLAAGMAQRVSLKLTAAIGALPAAQQSAMISLIEQALSDKQAEIDAALAQLAQRDAAFQTLVQERDAAKVQVATATQNAAKAKETALDAESKVFAKTNEVKAIAAALDAEKRKAGSLGESLDRILTLALWIAGGWAFLAFVLPGIVKHLDAGPLKTGLRKLSGYTTAPLLFSDAEKKIPNTNAQ